MVHYQAYQGHRFFNFWLAVIIHSVVLTSHHHDCPAYIPIHSPVVHNLTTNIICLHFPMWVPCEHTHTLSHRWIQNGGAWVSSCLRSVWEALEWCQILTWASETCLKNKDRLKIFLNTYHIYMAHLSADSSTWHPMKDSSKAGITNRVCIW